MTTDIELEEYAKGIGIKHFKGVYMKDSLPSKIGRKECGIVNLQNQIEPGSHWVCYVKNGRLKIYFDSYGLDPPVEIKKYLGRTVLVSNFQIQNFGTSICGELCLFILYKLNPGENIWETFQDEVLSLYSSPLFNYK